MAECFGGGLQNENGLLGDFRADAVAGEDSEVQKHAGTSLTTCKCRPGFARRTAGGGCPPLSLLCYTPQR
jgi:hypothetical protein